MQKKISMAPLYKVMYANEDDEIKVEADGDFCHDGAVADTLLVDSYEESGSDPYFRDSDSAAARTGFPVFLRHRKHFW